MKRGVRMKERKLRMRKGRISNTIIPLVIIVIYFFIDIQNGLLNL